MAIVIDDLGWVRKPASIYDEIDQPLTMAVMPGRPHSKHFYNRWKDKYEFIVHMPMEPIGYPEDDPGKLALMTDMTQSEIKSRMEMIFDRYPKAVGLNNHMGSAFTQDREGMISLMEVLAERGLFYFDSLTTSSSVAESVAEPLGVPVVRNQIFLDRERDRSSIEKKFNRLIEIARENGHAVGIGHMQSMETARVLREKLPEYRSSEVEFVTLSTIARKEPSSPLDSTR